MTGTGTTTPAEFSTRFHPRYNLRPLELRKGHLLLSVDVYDETGNHIAKLRRNAWTFRAPDCRVITDPNDLRLYRTIGATETLILRATKRDAHTIAVINAQLWGPKGTLVTVDGDYFIVPTDVRFRGIWFDTQGVAFEVDHTGAKVLENGGKLGSIVGHE